MTAGLRDTLVIARREFLERVKSKWYQAMIVLGPVFMIALLVVPALIASKTGKGARVEVIDKSGVLGDKVVEAGKLAGWNVTAVPATTTDEEELKRIKDDTINGFLVIPADALVHGQILYRGDNAANGEFGAQLRTVVGGAVFQARLEKFKLSENEIKALLEPANIARPQHTTGDAAASSGLGSFLIAYILAFILYMVITLYGVAVMRSIVQEKTSRVMEFLVAAVKPQSLMSGKILGVGGAAMLQLTIWLAVGALALANRETVLGWFGIHGTGAAALPELAFTEVSIVLVFFVLGFFFYSSMYAAVGAMVSSEQDTQQVQLPVTMMLVIGVMCLQVVSNAPRGSTTAIMTMVPLWSPILMPMRFVLGGATIAEVGISIGILLVSTVLVTRAAAKIYRVGVLLYGKRPSIRELIRWLRY
jgi:ABC-2 type transport system permease protein